ncbi:hypothetical protein LXL04_014621 [Taraxacum kok-saghyz]
MKEQLEQNSLPNISLHNGLLYVQGRLLIPNIPNLCLSLLQRPKAMIHFLVDGRKKNFTAWIYTWRTCRHPGNHTKTGYFSLNSLNDATHAKPQKYSTHKPYGLLQPLPTPPSPWHDISMDFITHLPPANSKTAIWVIVDHLTKLAHFISLPAHYTATSLATIFLKDIYRLHVLPNSILSDQDPLFLSHFWAQLFKQLGTKLRHSSAYHPQTDGQTEVINRCLEAYVRAFSCDEPKTWHRYLYLVELWYNTSFHSSINMSPFKAMYGREATTIHEYKPGTNSTASIDSTLQEHQRLIDLLKAALN